MVHIAHQHTSSHIERILQHVVRHLLAVHIERVVLTPYMCGCGYMVVEGHQYSLDLPQAMKCGVTLRPTKFFSFTCPLYVLTMPLLMSHSLSSLSVDLQQLVLGN